MFSDIGIEIVDAQMQDSEVDISRIGGKLMGDLSLPDNELGPARVEELAILQFYGVAVDVRLLGILLEERAHRVVSRHLGEVYHRPLDEIILNPAAMTMHRDIAFGLL